MFDLGSREEVVVGSQPWWAKFDWKTGFWYRDIKLGSKQTYRHIEADHATFRQDKNGVMICLHRYEEKAVSHRGKDEPQLFSEQEAEMWLWEDYLRERIDQHVTLDEVLVNEPSWKQLQFEANVEKEVV
jgi:hypothetical protein